MLTMSTMLKEGLKQPQTLAFLSTFHRRSTLHLQHGYGSCLQKAGTRGRSTLQTSKRFRLDGHKKLRQEMLPSAAPSRGFTTEPTSAFLSLARALRVLGFRRKQTPHHIPWHASLFTATHTAPLHDQRSAHRS
jgi:hypothetical protein